MILCSCLVSRNTPLLSTHADADCLESRISNRPAVGGLSVRSILDNDTKELIVSLSILFQSFPSHSNHS